MSEGAIVTPTVNAQTVTVCEVCGVNPLGMSPSSIKARKRMPHPWQCVLCKIKRVTATRAPRAKKVRAKQVATVPVLTSDEALAVAFAIRKVVAASVRRIAAAAKVPEPVAKMAVSMLLRHGLAVEVGEPGKLSICALLRDTDKAAILAAHAQWLETRKTRHLPIMQPGYGEKRDCTNYDECCDAFAHAHGDGVDGHCPEACERFAPFAEGWGRMWHDFAARKEWA